MELAVGTETVLGPEGEGADEVFVGDLIGLAGLNGRRGWRVRTDLDIVAAEWEAAECIVIAGTVNEIFRRG